MSAISSNIRVSLSSGAVRSGGPVALGVSSRLDSLADVVEISPANGHTLVYRSSDDKYVVQQLSLDDITGGLDGGTF